MSATILVADDDRAIRTVLNQALARLGHDVRMTGSASTLWRRMFRGSVSDANPSMMGKSGLWLLC